MIDGATETIKHEIKKKSKQDGGFLVAMMVPMVVSLIVHMASSLIQPVASLMINTISRKGVMRAGKGQEDGILLLLTLPFMMKVLGKGVTRVEKRHNNGSYG